MINAEVAISTAALQGYKTPLPMNESVWYVPVVP